MWSNSLSLAATTLLCLCFAPTTSAAATRNSSWKVYHSFNGGQLFSLRGTIDWSITENDETSPVEVSMTNDNGDLSAANLQAMIESGWYQVKLVNSNSKSSKDYVLSTVPACQVIRSNFRDEWNLVISPFDNKVLSLDYTPLVSPLAPKTCDDFEMPESAPKFESKLQLATETPGMVLKSILPTTKPPPGLTFLKRTANTKGSAGNAGAGGGASPDPEEDPQQQSFLRRYWYIIAPLFLMNLFGAPAEEQRKAVEGAAAGGSEAGSAPAAGSTGGSAPAGAGTPAKGRRGKRG